MDESLRMIAKCFASLTEADIWSRPNGHSNSIGNLILHLKGNITQYGIAAMKGLKDNRERDAEFEITAGFSKDDLLQLLKETVEKAKKSLSDSTPEELLRYREVQGFRFSGMGIMLHVVEHLSYHTGQIAFWTKSLKNKDLGFYEGIDLNTKNK